MCDVLCSPVCNGEVEVSRQGLDGKGRVKGVVYGRGWCQNLLCCPLGPPALWLPAPSLGPNRWVINTKLATLSYYTAWFLWKKKKGLINQKMNRAIFMPDRG